jgi:hypothetical protein
VKVAMIEGFTRSRFDKLKAQSLPRGKKAQEEQKKRVRISPFLGLLRLFGQLCSAW